MGTLTVVPVPAPTVVDRRVGGWAMTLAPLVGALLALAAGGLLWLLGRAGVAGGVGGWGGPGDWGAAEGAGGAGAGGPSAALAATLVVGLLALLTRGMHLDGLADTADGLGSRKPAAQALEVMRRGDVGPFGVVTLVLVLLVQVLALAELVAAGLGFAALLLALVVSRLALPMACSRGVPAARADGLGQVVAGSVGRGQLLLAGLLAAAVLVALAAALLGGQVVDVSVAARAAVAVLAGLGAAALLTRHAVHRLGGVTGDVLGAAVESAFTTVLVVLTLVV